MKPGGAITSHLYFQLPDAIQSTSDAAEVDAILDQHRAEGLDERHWRDIQETAMQHKEALRLAGARELGGAMADKERDDYGPPNPRWPTRPNPADLLLPLRKAERWLSEQDGEDRAYTLAMAAANMPRATPDELRETLATSQHADLRDLAGAEQQRRAVKVALGDITKEARGDPGEDREAAYHAWRAAALREQEQRTITDDTERALPACRGARRRRPPEGRRARASTGSVPPP